MAEVLKYNPPFPKPQTPYTLVIILLTLSDFGGLTAVISLMRPPLGNGKSCHVRVVASDKESILNAIIHIYIGRSLK